MKLKLTASLRVFVSVGALLFVAQMIAGQQPGSGAPTAQGSLTGKYEGGAKDATGEAKATLDLVNDSGKFAGTITTPLGIFKVKGQMADGVLTLEGEPSGSPRRLILRPQDDKLVGTMLDGTRTASIELRRVARDEISGEWEAAADAQGQAFPFTLILKVDGEKVTGSSSSQLGESTISTGTWKDGKLAVILESANGQIALIATLVDGKLVGDYDYSGQLQGKWVAVKKKP